MRPIPEPMKEDMRAFKGVEYPDRDGVVKKYRVL